MLIDSILLRLECLERRLNKLNIRGLVSEVDPERGSGGMVRVAYGDEQTSDWLPVKPLRSGKACIWWFPEVGEGVTITDLETGEVVPGSFTTDLPPPTRNPNELAVNFGDGASVVHSQETGILKVINIGNVEVSTEEKMILSTGSGFELIGDIAHTGALHSSGNIKSDGDVSDKVRSMKGDRDIFNKHVHPVGSPNTAKPTTEQ